MPRPWLGWSLTRLSLYCSRRGIRCGTMTQPCMRHWSGLRWRRALFLGLVSYAASLAAPVFDTFVPVLFQAGHPLWHNTTGLQAPPIGFALAPSLAFFIMTWDNVINLFVHPWAGARSDHTWTRWGRRTPWILVGVPLAVTGLLAIPLAPTLAGVLLAILVTNLGRALFVPPMIAWLGDLFPAPQRSQANAAFSLVSGVAAIGVLVARGVLFERVGRAVPARGPRNPAPGRAGGALGARTTTGDAL